MSLIWLFLLSILLILYMVFSLLLHHGLKCNYKTNQNCEFSVSVIVAARNEAENIKTCLNSLEDLNYPKESLEIIIINDRSEDQTHQIISRFVKDKPCFKYFNIERTVPRLSGKASAISQAIEQSRGEIILITDADCVVPKNWVRNMIRYFTDQVGLVAGFTLLEFSNGIFNRIQNLDWGYMLSVAAGAVGLGIPLTCMGNNFAFRRKAYVEVGGYNRVGFSVTEDFALLKEISQRTTWKIAFPIDSECLVKSKPVKSFQEFLSQRKRWAIGGQSVHAFGKILITTSVLTHLSIIIFFLFNQIYSLLGALFLLMMSDYVLMLFPMKQFHSARDLKYLPLYKIFFILYSVIVMVNLLFNHKVTWKGIQYQLKMSKESRFS